MITADQAECLHRQCDDRGDQVVLDCVQVDERTAAVSVEVERFLHIPAKVNFGNKHTQEARHLGMVKGGAVPAGCRPGSSCY